MNDRKNASHGETHFQGRKKGVQDGTPFLVSQGSHASPVKRAAWEKGKRLLTDEWTWLARASNLQKPFDVVEISGIEPLTS